MEPTTEANCFIHDAMNTAWIIPIYTFKRNVLGTSHFALETQDSYFKESCLHIYEEALHSGELEE
jgi:hypothetical protein